MSELGRAWYHIRNRLQELEKDALNSIVNSKEYREVVRHQEKVKVIRTLYAMESDFIKETKE
jgi:hypothetical protein